MEKGDRYWLNLCLVLFAALVAYIVFLAAETVGIATDWSNRYSWYKTVCYGLGLIVGPLVAIGLVAKEAHREYFLACITEVRKVTWPSAEDTRRMTIIVCVVVAVFAGIMLVFDTGWSAVLKKIVNP